MDDKTIETEIMEKTIAKNKYDDAIAEGNSAVIVNYNEELPDFLEFNIGAVPSNKSIQIDVRISTKCESFKHGQFSFVFPVNFLPIFIQERGGTIVSSATEFSSEIKILTDSKLNNLNVSHEEFKLDEQEGYVV